MNTPNLDRLVHAFCLHPNDPEYPKDDIYAWIELGKRARAELAALKLHSATQTSGEVARCPHGNEADVIERDDTPTIRIQSKLRSARHLCFCAVTAHRLSEARAAWHALCTAPGAAKGADRG